MKSEDLYMLNTFLFYSSSYSSSTMADNSLQPLSKAEQSSDSPSDYNQPNQSPELLMTLECDGSRTSISTIEKPNHTLSQSSVQQPTPNQGSSENLNRSSNSWEPLTPPQ